MTDRELIARVREIDFQIESYDWVLPPETRARIDAHWDRLREKSPTLFDGRVLLAHRVTIDGDVLRGACFETSYKSFLGWRDFDFPGAPVFNCFGMPALRAADGAFLLGEMSAGTANAGRLYFPAGTPEPADANADGRLDLETSILRELEEETGIAPGEIRLEPGWTIVFERFRPIVACIKVARSSSTADVLQARLRALNARHTHPELVRLVPVRSAADFDAARMPEFMLSYLGDALGSEGAKDQAR